jgi:CDP-diacylglycerol--glycerol-3-phosphate 3-phosphatidyltransferase
MVKPETIDRLKANSLTAARIIAAPYIWHKLRTTKPEERSWKFAAFVAAVWASDYFDGVYGRRAGPDKLGRFGDPLADKLLKLAVLHALYKNGEIPESHFYINLARDIGVTAIRWYGESHDTDTSAHFFNKIVTAATAANTVLAASPMSVEYNPLIETISEITTASAVVGGLGYIEPFFLEPKKAA